MLGWFELKWISCVCWETAIINPGVCISKQWPRLLGNWLNEPAGQLDKYSGWGHCGEGQNLIKVHMEIQICYPNPLRQPFQTGQVLLILIAVPFMESTLAIAITKWTILGCPYHVTQPCSHILPTMEHSRISVGHNITLSNHSTCRPSIRLGSSSDRLSSVSLSPCTLSNTWGGG